MSKAVPKNSPTPPMVNWMLSELLKPLPFWQRFGKAYRARVVYVQTISKAYESEFTHGRALLQLGKHLQESNEEIGEDLNSLKLKVNKLVKQALADDSALAGPVH